MSQAGLSFHLLNPGLYMQKSFYGPGMSVITSKSAEVNRPGYGSNHHTWCKHFQLTLPAFQAATKAVFPAVQDHVQHTASRWFQLCLTFVINKFILRPLSHPTSFHKAPVRLSENRWHMKDSPGLWHLFFFFPAKENYMKKKKYPTNRRGWVVFVLVSRLLCFSFHLERLPDKCIPDWKPSIYRKLLCLYENNINRILPSYSPFPCKDLHALYKVNVIVPILQTVKLNHSVKCMTSSAIKWHRFPRPGSHGTARQHGLQLTAKAVRHKKLWSSGRTCASTGADERSVSRWIAIFMAIQQGGLACHWVCYHWWFRAALTPISCCICVAKWKRRN